MKGLLKFITCGSVDDGKSTLIGHILYDSKLLYADQEKALELDSKVGSREGKIDYSLLLDGLMAEREQGITIDVAYRYFTTDNRSFIVADTPGHEEYTRNMAVGASFADLAVILVDAKQGVLIQTKRHARICALMGIKHFVFAVNKMDLVGYSEERFNEINAQIAELTKELSLADVVVIPVSATEGDNVSLKIFLGIRVRHFFLILSRLMLMILRKKRASTCLFREYAVQIMNSVVSRARLRQEAYLLVTRLSLFQLRSMFMLRVSMSVTTDYYPVRP